MLRLLRVLRLVETLLREGVGEELETLKLRDVSIEGVVVFVRGTPVVERLIERLGAANTLESAQAERFLRRRYPTGLRICSGGKTDRATNSGKVSLESCAMLVSTDSALRRVARSVLTCRARMASHSA